MVGESYSSQSHPAISIVVPVHEDEEWVGRAITSCLSQTTDDLEVICVDDASADGTCEVIDAFCRADPRVRLIRQASNRSAFQARRVGILAARAPFVLFLDGDDELTLDAARRASEIAQTTDADVVGFGVELVTTDGDTAPRRFEADLQPQHEELVGDEILPTLFPAGHVAQGHLWRYLWSTRLLVAAYRSLPADLQLYRANDIPITMLALGHAQKYVSTSERLYRYFFRRGGSGRRVADPEHFAFFLTGLDSVDVIAEGIREIADQHRDPTPVLDTHESARLSSIQVILRYAATVEDDDQQAECLSMLVRKAGASDVVRAAATFFRDALPLLARHRQLLAAPATDRPRTIMLFAGNLGSGGVQGVVVSQARHLQQAGYRVVVALRTLDGMVHELPEGVELVEVTGRSLGEKLRSIRATCREYAVDRMIDHYLLYNDDWPYFALTVETQAVSTIGWIHNFALRPMFDFNHRTAYLTRYLPLLEQVVTLSAADVAFWRSQGVDRTVYLPNPPSPWLVERPLRTRPRSLSEGPLRLVWWGRIQQHTKRVRELIEVAAALRELEVDFTLTIIGPDSGDLTRDELREEAINRGVDDAVRLPGPMYGDELLSALDDADMHISTSAIEGYPLTLIEAQALGLPIAMYELPWLAVAEGNEGMITAPQEDSRGLARAIAAVDDEAVYAQRSRNSLDAAAAALQHDFTDLYERLLKGTLPDEYTPERTPEIADLLLERAVDFHEQNVGRQQRHDRRLRGQIRAVEQDRDRHVEHMGTSAVEYRAQIRKLRRENRRLKNRLRVAQSNPPTLRTSLRELRRKTLVPRREIRRLLSVDATQHPAPQPMRREDRENEPTQNGARASAEATGIVPAEASGTNGDEPTAQNGPLGIVPRVGRTLTRRLGGTRQVTLHIGAHRTASSLLQSTLRRDASILQLRGLGQIHRRAILNSTFHDDVRRLIHGETRGATLTDGKQSFAELLRDSPRDVVLTNEDFFESFNRPQFYRRITDALDYVCQIAGTHDIRVVLYVRNQVDYIESMFMQHIHLGHDRQFGPFLTRYLDFDLSWKRVLDDIARVVGPENAVAVPYESVERVGATEFYRTFLSLCGVEDPSGLEITEDETLDRRANRSYSQDALEIANVMNPQLDPDGRRTLRQFLQENHSTATHPRPVLVPEGQRREILGRLRGDNEQLFAEYMPDWGADRGAYM